MPAGKKVQAIIGTGWNVSSLKKVCSPSPPPRKTGLSECKECKSVYPGVYFSTPGKHVIFANIKKRNNAI